LAGVGLRLAAANGAVREGAAGSSSTGRAGRGGIENATGPDIVPPMADYVVDSGGFNTNSIQQLGGKMPLVRDTTLKLRIGITANPRGLVVLLVTTTGGEHIVGQIRLTGTANHTVEFTNVRAATYKIEVESKGGTVAGSFETHSSQPPGVPAGQIPGVSELPDVPGHPDIPDVPDQPDVPDVPDQPDVEAPAR
jgi:hypothetical protein